jgi:hypothetical protein
MPIADRQVSPEPRKPFSFRMPLAPADYLDRSPLLTDEERRGITSLLQLTPPHYLEFDRLVKQLSRVTQPLLDVLALFHEWRPKSRAVRQGFLTYVLKHVLQTNTLYWGWSQATWGAVIDALPNTTTVVIKAHESVDERVSGVHDGGNGCGEPRAASSCGRATRPAAPQATEPVTATQSPINGALPAPSAPQTHPLRSFFSLLQLPDMR